MYIILVYDLASDRTSKIHKKCSIYLSWKQNSVFEGEVTESQYEKLTTWIDDYFQDSETVIIYRFRNKNAVKKTSFW